MATISPSTAEIVRQSGAIPGAEYLLEVSNVRKAFPGVLALDDVSFRLRRGHVHALMGENGADKSTLMKIIAGIYTPDSGSFRLKGQEIRLTSPPHAGFVRTVGHRHRPGGGSSRPQRRQSSDGRDRQGGVLRFRRPYHGRAD